MLVEGRLPVDSGIQRVRVSEQVSQRLSEEIANGRLQSGDALPSERQLARIFKVSIPVIRESIRILSAKGLVSVRHGVGTFVNSHECWNSAEPLSLLMRREQSTLLCVHEVRAKLETEIAELAALRATEEQLTPVADALARMASTVHSPTIHCSADLDFHLALARATGNPMFAVVLQPIMTLILSGMLRGSTLPEAIERGVREHGAIYECVCRHDPGGARAAMVVHMQTSHDELVAVEDADSSRMLSTAPYADRRDGAEREAPVPWGLPPSSMSTAESRERRRAGSLDRSR